MEGEIHTPESAHAAQRQRVLCRLLLPVALAPALASVGRRLALSDAPTWVGLTGRWVEIVANWGVYLALLLLPFALLSLIQSLFSRRAGFPKLQWAAMSVAIMFGIAGYAEGNSEAHRLDLLGQVEARSRPLVAAIEAFKRRHGRYPSRLDELVPRYLPQVPKTGLAGYSEYRYNADVPGYDLFIPLRGQYNQDQTMTYRRDAPDDVKTDLQVGRWFAEP